MALDEGRRGRELSEKLDQLLDRMGTNEESQQIFQDRLGAALDNALAGLELTANKMQAQLNHAIKSIQLSVREHSYHNAKIEDRLDRLGKRMDKLEEPGDE